MKNKIVTLATLTVVLGIVSGCSAIAKPYDSKISSINAAEKKIANQKTMDQKTSALKQLEEEFQKYQQGKNPYKQVVAVYRNDIDQLKGSIKKDDQKTIKNATPDNPMKETQSTLEAKNAKLKELKGSLIQQRGVVYTNQGFKQINDRIDQQINTNHSQIKSYILSTDSTQKYVDAYKKFTLQGKSKGLQRGSGGPREKGFYAAIGLSKSDYNALSNGIYDYYGNAVDEGWITQRQSETAYIKAQKKLLPGDYAKHSTDLHEMNFYQIETGDYSALIDSWKEVAEGVNPEDGTGFHWGPIKAGYRFTISKNQLSDSQIIFNRNNLGVSKISEIDSTGKLRGDSLEVRFSNKVSFAIGDALIADASTGPRNYTITFLPKGSRVNDWPSGINTAKEHIEIHTSNMSFSEVFERK